ncbi:hypothetical protein V2H45_14610 [Tumidithrix elongata RA019]|uniref:Uncharacterized protein n=1 Tax=Tumidithrix elongata BACA0141 TaxID=2716417 RepID=A0AAW9PSH9_9CYAN|nr:hypothetical protein [Tumidithrix elongata RA019]
MKSSILFNSEILMAIAWAWSCGEDIEYFIAYDPDVINVLLTIAMFKPIEILVEYLSQRRGKDAA